MCPNIYECWEDREATFLILGDKCTRRCGFCDVMTAKPDPGRRGRARAHRRRGPTRWACATSCSPASLVTTCPTAARGSGPPRIRAVRRRRSRMRRRGPADRLQGRRARHRHGDRRRTRRVRAQPGDGPAAARPDPPRVRLRPLAGRAADRQAPPLRARSRSPTSSWGWARRPEEVAEAHGRPAGRRLRPPDDGPVPAADEAPPARGSLGHARRVRRAHARRRGHRASRTWKPGRWFGARTTPASSSSGRALRWPAPARRRFRRQRPFARDAVPTGRATRLRPEPKWWRRSRPVSRILCARLAAGRRPSLSALARRGAVRRRRAAYPGARTGRPRTLPAWPCSGWGLPSRRGRPRRW